MRPPVWQKPAATVASGDDTGRGTASLPQPSGRRDGRVRPTWNAPFAPALAGLCCHVTRAYTAPRPTLQQYADCFLSEIRRRLGADSDARTLRSRHPTSRKAADLPFLRRRGGTLQTLRVDAFGPLQGRPLRQELQHLLTAAG